MTYKFGIELIKEHDKEIYNNALDDFVEKVELKYLGVHPDELYEKYYPREICEQIKEIAKQLKEQVKNNEDNIQTNDYKRCF